MIPTKNEKPSVARRRGQMISELVHMGIPGNIANQIVGKPNSTAGNIGFDLAAYVATLPKQDNQGKGKNK